MRRALFFREFRSALVPNLITVGAILATLVVVEHIYGLRLGKAEDIRDFTDLALAVGLVVSGFISGERCFPSELKESRVLFLSSLPISRTGIWLCIVVARLLAALTSLLLGFAFRPQLLRLLFEKLPWMDFGFLAILVLYGYVLFFSAGTLFALLFRRPLFSYAAGLAILGILLFETTLSCSFAQQVPSTTLSWTLPMPPESPPQSMLWFLSLLITSALLLSWRFFAQGEIGNARRRLKNQILFGATVASYLVLVFGITASPRLASIGSRWGLRGLDPFSSHGLPYSISPDGKYLAVFESPGGKPFMVRVSVFDTQEGRMTGRSIYGGIFRAYWSSLGRGDALNLLVLNNSPLDRWGYLVPGTVEWIRLSPEVHEISRQRLPGAKAIESLAGGRALAVLEEAGLSRVLLLDGASGRSSEVARGPLDGRVSLSTEGAAALVYFDNQLVPRKAWVVDSVAREIKVPRSAVQTSFVLFGEVAGSRAEAEAMLLRRFGSPSTPGGVPVNGHLILPTENHLWLVTEAAVTGLYFLEERQPAKTVLWARSTAPGGQWRELRELKDYSPSRWRPSFQPDFSSGVGAIFPKDSNGRFFVYDPRIGNSSEAGGCAPGERFFLDARRVLGLEGILVKLTCWADASARVQSQYFEYLPGLGKTRTVRTAVGLSAPLWDLYVDEQGRGIGIVSGKSEEIWSSAPYRKDLRLWPTSRNPSL